MKKFLMDLVERATKTAAQAALAAIGSTATMGEVNWVFVASTTGLATILSFLTSIAGRGIGDSDSASFVQEKDER